MFRFVSGVLFSFYLLSSGCSEISVHYNYDPQADFVSFQTFKWMQQPDIPAGNTIAMSFNNIQFEKRIESVVDSALYQKGLRLTTNDNADLYVVYHTYVKEKTDSIDWGRRYDMSWGIGNESYDKYTFEEGTLIVEFINPENKQLLWQGIAAVSLPEAALGNKEEKKIELIVRKLLSNFPPID